jgi:subtilisin family serine protease
MVSPQKHYARRVGLQGLAAGLIAAAALTTADPGKAQSIYRPTPSPSITRIGPDTMRSPSISPRYPSNWSRTDRDDDLDVGSGSDGGGSVERSRIRRLHIKKKTNNTVTVSRSSKQRHASRTVSSQSGGGGSAITPSTSGPTVRARFTMPRGDHPHVTSELLVDAGSVSRPALDAMMRRHRMTILESQSFSLLGRTLHLCRSNDGLPAARMMQGLSRERALVRVQLNQLFGLAQQPDAAPTTPTAPASADASEGDPAQYVVSKLRLPQTHRLATGDKVLVAVIDSGIDGAHPDLDGVIAARFDAVGGNAKPHPHGTGMAGAIASHGKLIGVAPRVRLLAARAFAPGTTTAEGTTMNILKSLEWASQQGARVVNMSFAGPSDPAIGEALGKARQKGIVLIAAAGNAGPRSPPLYPAADPNVIADTATDADDKLFAKANRGNHIAVAAPGVDILVPAPEGAFQLTSGTSVAAAHVSGVAALLIERKASLSPDQIRRILTATARQVGRTKDKDLGAGLIDALDAVISLDSDGPKAGANLRSTN